MIVLYFLGYFYRNKQNSYAALSTILKWWMCDNVNSPVILSLYLKIIATEGFSLQNVLLVSLE